MFTMFYSICCKRCTTTIVTVTHRFAYSRSVQQVSSVSRLLSACFHVNAASTT